MDRLQDTPEFQQASRSSSGRSRRSNVGRPSRDAARNASENIQKNVKEERGRVPKPSETEVKPEVKTEFKNKLEPKTEAKSPEVRKGPGRPPKRKRPEKKEDEEVSKKARDQIEKDHGWTVLGESSRRPILKPVRHKTVFNIFFYFMILKPTIASKCLFRANPHMLTDYVTKRSNRRELVRKFRVATRS